MTGNSQWLSLPLRVMLGCRVTNVGSDTLPCFFIFIPLSAPFVVGFVVTLQLKPHFYIIVYHKTLYPLFLLHGFIVAFVHFVLGVKHVAWHPS